MKNLSIPYLSKLFFLVFIMILSCGSPKEEVTAETPNESNTIDLSQAQFDLAGIELGAASTRSIGSELKVSGIIDVPPQSNISINMPYGGFVKYIEILPGTRVKKGQFLVTIENPEFIQFQQDYLESLANSEYLKAEFQRQEELFKEKVASAKNYELAKSTFLSNEARIHAMEARLKLIGFDMEKIKLGQISSSVSLYSPVSGSVREVYTNLGKYINPQDVIMDITNSDDLHVELTVYENEITRVRAGQRIRFALANSPDDWREAIVFLVGSGVREDRSVTVHGHLEQHFEDLLPGMYVMAKIETGSSEVLTLPAEAIVRFDGKHYVFDYAGEGINHKFALLEVIAGESEDGYTHISPADSSVHLENLRLVTKGAFTLLAKSKNQEEEE